MVPGILALVLGQGASLTAAKTSHCGGNTCAGEQYVVSSITAGLRDASATSVGSVFIPGWNLQSPVASTGPASIPSKTIITAPGQ